MSGTPSHDSGICILSRKTGTSLFHPPHFSSASGLCVNSVKQLRFNRFWVTRLDGTNAWMVVGYSIGKLMGICNLLWATPNIQVFLLSVAQNIIQYVSSTTLFNVKYLPATNETLPTCHSEKVISHVKYPICSKYSVVGGKSAGMSGNINKWISELKWTVWMNQFTKMNWILANMTCCWKRSTILNKCHVAKKRRTLHVNFQLCSPHSVIRAI